METMHTSYKLDTNLKWEIYVVLSEYAIPKFVWRHLVVDNVISGLHEMLYNVEMTPKIFWFVHQLLLWKKKGCPFLDTV